MLKKNTLWLIVITILSICHSKISAQSIISGTTNSDSIFIETDELLLGFTASKTIAIPSNKIFKTTIPIKNPQIIKISSADTTIDLFAEPGDSINIDLTSITKNITGKGSANNIFLLQFNQKFFSPSAKKELDEKIKSQSADAFEMTAYNSKRIQNDFYTNFQLKSEFSESFKKYITNTIRYQYLYSLVAYPIVNASRPGILTVTPLPETIEEPVKKMTATHEDALISESYRNFIYYYVTYYTSQANNYNKFTDFSVSLEKKYYCARLKLEGKVLAWYLAKFICSDGQKATPSAIKKAYTGLAEAEKNGIYSKTVSEKCGAYINSKDPEKGSSVETYSFKLKDLKGRNVSLSDFKGKVLYVDFWASWCGPCRQQFPYSKLLKSQLTDKQSRQIEFLYISIDEDENAWKNAINQNQLEGIQTLSPGNWSSEAVKFFRINSIPRYMIIDKQGNIADPNAKRPSAEGILQDLIRLSEL